MIIITNSDVIRDNKKATEGDKESLKIRCNIHTLIYLRSLKSYFIGDCRKVNGIASRLLCNISYYNCSSTTSTCSTDVEGFNLINANRRDAFNKPTLIDDIVEVFIDKPLQA